MAASNSFTAWVVSRGLFDSHNALPRLNRARAVSMCLLPDFLSKICSSSLPVCYCWLILVLVSCIYCKYVLRPSLGYVDVCERYDRLAAPLSFGSTMRSGHTLGIWRCRLNLSMFLLTISVVKFWSVQFVLEFNAIKKNLRIMSDMERVFWTVLFRMASRVFLFFTPSDSSLVRNWFVCKEHRTPVVKLV